jgi:Tol biopolymer transport system component
LGIMRKTLLILTLGLFFLVQAGGICWSQTTERVSVSFVGDDSNGASNLPSISSDGRYVAFQSGATDLVPVGTNGFIHIFVRDRQTGTTTQVSLHTNGTEGEGPSSDPSISTNGRFVAFESEAGNLVAGDTAFPSGFPDIFVNDLQTGETTWVSEDSLGGEGDGPSLNPSISADGRYIAFQSEATGLVAPGGSDGSSHIFVRDRQTLTITQVSVNSLGAQGNNHSYSPSISEDGRYVAFDSAADNLVAGDTPVAMGGFIDIFVHDRDADGNGTYDEVGGVSTVRVSVASGGGEGNGHSYSPSISGDGRYVAFYSEANNVVGSDSNGSTDVFVHDRDADGNGAYDEVGGVSTVRVSVASGGGEGNGHSYSPSISGDGRYVAFYSEADNLVAGDTPVTMGGFIDIFVHDRDADGNGTYDEVGGVSTVRVSVASGGGEGNGHSYSPSISADGKFVAFHSDASNLLGVGNDTNGSTDIFVYERESLPPNVDSTSPANNAKGVGVGTTITATFSKPMNGSTIDTNTFTLDNGVTGTVSYDANNTTARFTPTSKLAYDTTYTATITTAAEDLAGNPMQTDYTWSFTTESEKNNSSVSISCFIATAASDRADF